MFRSKSRTFDVKFNIEFDKFFGKFWGNLEWKFKVEMKN